MKLNWKAGLLYTLIIQVATIVYAFFIQGALVILVRFIFDDGLLREIVSVLVLFVGEMICRYIPFLATFKNNKGLSFPQFCLDYLLTLGVRLVFSLCTFFAFWSAGATINVTGVLIASSLINKDIITMQQVPTYIYLIVFTVFEAFTILTALLSYKTAEAIRKKESKELKSN